MVPNRTPQPLYIYIHSNLPKSTRYIFSLSLSLQLFIQPPYSLQTKTDRSTSKTDDFVMSRGCHDSDCAGEIMLFGVRIREDNMRKCVSMNNLSDYQLPQESSNAAVGGGCASADECGHRQGSVNRERKRG